MSMSLQELIDREEVYDVIMRYTHYMDLVDIDNLMECFHEGADIGFPSDVYQGKGQGFVKEFLANEERNNFKDSMHMVGNMLIDLDGDVAYVESYMYAIVESSPTNPRWGDKTLTFWGRYISRVEKRNDEWRLAEHRLLLDWQRDNTTDGWYELPPERRKKRDLTDPALTHERWNPNA